MANTDDTDVTTTDGAQSIGLDTVAVGSFMAALVSVAGLSFYRQIRNGMIVARAVLSEETGASVTGTMTGLHVHESSDSDTSYSLVSRRETFACRPNAVGVL